MAFSVKITLITTENFLKGEGTGPPVCLDTPLALLQNKLWAENNLYN